jgi:hypothetical protein
MTAESLAGVRVLPGRPKPPPPVGDFSYVEVVGCLTAAPNNTWVLTNASDPVSVALSEESRPQIPNDLDSRGLGSQTFHLLDALAYGPQTIAGHRVYVRGLLIRLPSEQRLTISALQPIAPGCGK